MPVKIAVLKETRPNERRVAMVPAVADKLAKLGAQIHMQSGAGDAVKLPDSAFKNVHVRTPIRSSWCAMPTSSLSVQPPELPIVAGDEGRRDPDFVHLRAQGTGADPTAARSQDHDCFAMELVPRITRAQAMDALSSQAALAGLLRSAARRDQPRAHPADDDHGGRLDPPRARRW